MAWHGKSSAEICEQIKDPARNGNRSLEAIHEHMTNDTLVGWAWHPGQGRKPAPGTQAGFCQLIAAWIETGATCLSEKPKQQMATDDHLARVTRARAQGVSGVLSV